ncbi:MAG: MBL fold metallo-hydrolase, partial [Pseudomonadota bacterium]
MFEAVIAICAGLAGEICRDQLVPGYAATDRAACEALLAARPPDVAADCKPAGPVLSTEEVAPGVFVHMGAVAEPDGANLGDVANLGFVIGQDSVAVIDAGSAAWLGEALWRAIRAETAKPVSHLILTHHHPDHAFGAGLFAAAGAEIVAPQGFTRALADRQANYVESLERLIGTQ